LAIEAFEPVISDGESIALRWVPTDEVEALALHPGFAASWPGLRLRLGSRRASAGVVPEAP
jgi:8-oxo-dGTP diphosphatase